MWIWMLETFLISGLLALVTALFCRFFKTRPALCHCLWVLVLVRVMMPPLPVSLPLSVSVQRLLDDSGRHLAAWFELDRPEAALSAVVAAAPDRQLSEMGTPMIPAGVMRGPELGGDGGTLAARFDEPFPEEADAADLNAGVGRKAISPPSPFSTPAGASEAAAPPVFRINIGWAGIFVLTWVLVGLLLVGRQISAMVTFGRTLAYAEPAPDLLVRQVAQLSDRLHLRPPVVKTLHFLGSPFVWSFGKPLLLWPACRIAINDSAVKAVLIHELAHLRRKDHWIAWLELAGLGLCWWNPVFWLARARLRFYSELACDAWAVCTFPKQRRAYAEALIDAADRSATVPPALAALGANHSKRQNFERRLTMIMRRGIFHQVPWMGVAGALLLMVMVLPGWSPAPKPNKPSSLNSWTVSDQIDPELRPAVELALTQRLAERHENAEEWGKAAELYGRLAEHHPEMGRLQKKLGWIRLKNGDAAGAAEAFERQIELDFDLDEAHFSAARAHAAAGNKRQVYQHLESALENGFHRAESLMEEDFEAYGEEAEFLKIMKSYLKVEKLIKDADRAFDDDRWGEAVDAYTHLATLLPGDGGIQSRLGYALFHADRYAEAGQAFARQLDLDHEPETAAYNLACAHALVGQKDKAIAQLERAVELGYDNAQHLLRDDDLENLREMPAFEALYQRLAEAHEHKGSHREAVAVENFQKIQDMAMRSSKKGHDHGVAGKLYEAWAFAAFSRGNYQDALKGFKHQILAARSGHTGRVLYNMACTHAQLGESERALAYLRHAVETGFTDAHKIVTDNDLKSLREDARFQEIQKIAAEEQVLHQFGATDWEHLLDRARARLEKEPNNGKFHHYLGWAYLRLGEHDRAEEAFLQQEKFGYSPVTARYNLACIAALKGDRDKAFNWLDEALEAGLDDEDHVRNDEDLAGLRDDSRFEAFLEKLD